MVPGVPVRLAVGVPVVSLVVLLTLVRGVAVTVPPVHPPAWLTLPVFPPVSSLQSGVLPHHLPLLVLLLFFVIPGHFLLFLHNFPAVSVSVVTLADVETKLLPEPLREVLTWRLLVCG